ncbi:hypothetical protein AOQ84DRAFT_272911, partial [Glonium stellatum]
WHRLIVGYSAMCPTYPADKLPAFSGLAQLFRRHRPATASYLAGLWSDNLPADLVWYNPQYPDSVPCSERAPSWSWACRDG